MKSGTTSAEPAPGKVAGDSAGASPGRPPGRGYQPIDLLVLVYFLVTGLLLLISPHSFPGKARYAAVHVLFLIAVSLLRFTPREGAALWRFFRDWYVFIALPFFYAAVRYLNRSLCIGYHDEAVVRIEQSIFGMQPSQSLHEILSFGPLSEFLHLAYLLYLVLIPLGGFGLYLRRRYAAYREFATSTLLTYYVCYLFFILLPVRGPFHYFGPLELPEGAGLFASLVHGMLHNVSSAGTAFPSSHVAAAVAIWLLSRRHLRWESHVIGLISLGIFVGTVYGGFHYAVDALAGLIVGGLLGTLGPRVHRLLARVASG